MSEEDFRNVGLANWAQHQAQQVEDIAEKSDLVARLRAENERLREALTEIATGQWGDIRTAFVVMRDIARAALKENSDE